MFICNIKVNNSLIKKLGITLISLIVLIVFIVVGFKFYNAVSAVKVKDKIDNSNLDVTSSNYTSILKDSHENIDKYVGKKIKFTGFVYRLYDFSTNQFVLAREMIISSDNHAVVVGFLSESNDSCNYKDGTWVEAEGVIEKGFYHGDIPVIKVKNLKEVSVPSDEYVCPPDGSYISSEI